MIVQKYGGTSVATIEKIKNIAKIVSQRLITEKKMVIVVSAQSGETDNLLAYAKKVDKFPLREVDQIVSLGENKSIALLAMALTSCGVKAVSLTGWQAGIVTTEDFSQAKINQIKIERIKKQLKTFDVVVVAGFQGVTIHDEITTLGKGGSDTTATALAGVLGCGCEIYTDVSGVFACDPKLLPNAKKIIALTYDELMEISSNGAKIMETRSVEIAKKYGVKFFVAKSGDVPTSGTLVEECVQSFEDVIIKNIIAKDDVYWIKIKLNDFNNTSNYSELFKYLKIFEMFTLIKNGNESVVSFVVHDDSFAEFEEQLLAYGFKVLARQKVSKLTLVGSGLRTHKYVVEDILKIMQKANIDVQAMEVNELSCSILVKPQCKMVALNCLAQKFGLVNPTINLAIVGATGMVGKTFLQLLIEQGFSDKIENLYLYASEKSYGKKIAFAGKEYKVETLAKENILNKQIDYAFFSVGEDLSKQFASCFTEIGAVVIDNSSAFRMEKDVPLIVPEVNFTKTLSKIIANPNCSTIQCVVPLFALKKFGIKKINFCTYQAVSGSGDGGLEDLERTQNGQTPKLYPYPIFNNCLPQIGKFEENGFTTEELKMVNETHKILCDNKIEISATCVRVPVKNCHSVSVCVELEEDVSKEDIVMAFVEQEGVVVIDDVAEFKYPINQTANGKNQIYVGRIRKDLCNSRIVHFWCVADNVRKGAAFNALQILEKILK